MHLSETHFQFVDSKQNHFMIFLVTKQPCDIILFLSEVDVRILTNQIVSVSNDLLYISGEYSLSKRHTKCNLPLDSSANFIRGFYFNMRKLLRAYSFVDMYEKTLWQMFIIRLKHLKSLTNLV